jgi:hypothetical protein
MAGKKSGGKSYPKKGKLLERMAKATGTTTGEARGVMKIARGQIAAGKTKAATKTIQRNLRGGPQQGITRTPKTSAKAEKKAKHVVARIAKKQKSK